MQTSDITPQPTKLSLPKLAMLLLAVLAIFTILWLINRAMLPSAPTQSTTDARPNSQQNVPDEGGGSVTQGSNPREDATPDPNGAGANTLLEE